jgi:hypothetical protein
MWGGDGRLATGTGAGNGAGIGMRVPLSIIPAKVGFQELERAAAMKPGDCLLG